MICRLRLLPEIIFQCDNAGRDLASKSVRSGMTAIATQGSQFALSMVSTVVLARLLTPNDFGLIGMVTVLLGFAQMFANAGLSMVTIQEECITHEQISTLFWVNFTISALVGLCILSCSQLVAMFYGRPELIAITAALSTSLVFSGLGIQHQALLFRHMCFGALAFIQITTQAIAMSVTIVLAWLGWGYWSLVVSQLIGVIVSLLLTLFFCPWVPSWVKRSSDVRGMLTFGGHLTVTNIANYFSSNTDNILIGRFIGADALGLYSKAYQLFMMPLSYLRDPIANVALPVLSSLKGNPDRYATYYQLIVGTLATITIPISLYCVVEAEFLISVFLGSQWLGAIPVFRIIALAGVMYPLNGMQALVTMNMGFSSRFACWGLASAILYVTAFLVGLPFGIEGVATGFTSVTFIIGFASMFYCFRKTHVSARQFVTAQIPPFLVSLLALSGLFFAQYAWPNNSTSEALTRFAVFCLICIGVSCCRKSFRQTVTLILREFAFSADRAKASESGD
jgi:O-antigen/teichoic acid export membrane protein